MQVARKSPQLPEPFQKVTFFADLSQYTIQARKKIDTSILQHKVMYKWGFHTKVIVSKNGVTYIMTKITSDWSMTKGPT